MEIYILFKDYYDDNSCFKGVFSKIAMGKKKHEFAMKQKKENDNTIIINEKLIEQKQVERKELIKFADSNLLINQNLAEQIGDKELVKILRKQRKKYLKQSEQIRMQIVFMQEEIEKLSTKNEEDLNTQYMAENHLYFKKAELIENVCDGDWMIDEDYIIDNEDEF